MRNENTVTVEAGDWLKRAAVSMVEDKKGVKSLLCTCVRMLLTQARGRPEYLDLMIHLSSWWPSTSRTMHRSGEPLRVLVHTIWVHSFLGGTCSEKDTVSIRSSDPEVINKVHNCLTFRISGVTVSYLIMRIC